MDGKAKSLSVLAAFVAVCFAAAGIGGIATASSVDTWYASLEKPSWAPPGWLFGPVWSVLYLTMAIAAWLLWRRRRVLSVRLPLTLFFIQLTLNAGWSWLFFGLQLPGLAFAELVLLWFAILATMLAFAKRVTPSGWLMAPYLLWTTFAAALNLAIWRLNV